MSFISISKKPFSLEYHSSTNSWSKFLIVGSNSCFLPSGIDFLEMERAKKSLCHSYLITLSLRRLSFSAICALCFCWWPAFIVMKMLSSLYLHWQVHMLKLPSSTKMIGVCSSGFLFAPLLLVSSPCLDLLLKKIADWSCLMSPVDII